MASDQTAESAVPDQTRLWPYEMKDLHTLSEALEEVLNKKLDNLYIHGGSLEVRCDDQRIGYFRVTDDCFVFDMDRGVVNPRVF